MLNSSLGAWGIIAVMIGYFAMLIVVSRFTVRKKDNQAFFLASRSAPWWAVAFGMIGASLSGVTFISVPGWVESSSFSYLQMVLGYFVGYLVVARVLLPVFYRLELTSIYGYLGTRFGRVSRYTGSSFFLISRLLGSCLRLYLVAAVLQQAVFDELGIPFWLTTALTIGLIYVYTARGGIQTIVWTDALQTVFLLAALVLAVFWLWPSVEWSFAQSGLSLANHPMSRVFFFDQPEKSTYFWRQFASGALITISMTGLDQDMMQKNLSCRSLADAQKNMFWFSVLLIGVNAVFLLLGFALSAHSARLGLDLHGDALFPGIALRQSGNILLALAFVLGLVAAAYSSADSALTALTASFCHDILGSRAAESVRIRQWVHVSFAVVFILLIVALRRWVNAHVIEAIFKAAGYTYGPLLALFGFGLISRRMLREAWVPWVCVMAPILTFSIDLLIKKHWGWSLGFEVLAVNAALSAFGLWIISFKPSHLPSRASQVE